MCTTSPKWERSSVLSLFSSYIKSQHSRAFTYSSKDSLPSKESPYYRVYMKEYKCNGELCISSRSLMSCAESGEVAHCSWNMLHSVKLRGKRSLRVKFSDGSKCHYKFDSKCDRKRFLHNCLTSSHLMPVWSRFGHVKRFVPKPALPQTEINNNNDNNNNNNNKHRSHLKQFLARIQNQNGRIINSKE